MGPRPEWEEVNGADQELAVQVAPEPPQDPGGPEQQPSGEAKPEANPDLTAQTPEEHEGMGQTHSAKSGVSQGATGSLMNKAVVGAMMAVGGDATYGSSGRKDGDPMELWSATLTWDFTTLIQPRVLLPLYFSVAIFSIYSGLFQSIFYVKEVMDVPSTRANTLLAASLINAIGLGTMFLPTVWIFWAGFRGDYSSRWPHLHTGLTIICIFLEVLIRQKSVLFGLIVLIPGGALLLATLPGDGTRKGYGAGMLMCIGFFQALAWALNKYCPPLLAKMPPMLAAVFYPSFAMFYETSMMPLIFYLWFKPFRRDNPDILLTWQMCLVRYVGEGLYMGGLMNTVDKNPDELVPLMCGCSILCRSGGKFLARIGFWDMIRGKLLGSKFNTMNDRRDLLGRCCTSQCWMMAIMTPLLGMYWGTLFIYGEIYPEVDRVYFGGVFRRGVFWVVAVVASLAALLSEFCVAVFICHQRRQILKGDSSMTVWQTYRSLHLPGMQSMMGVGEGYPKHLINVKDALVPGAPCCKELSKQEVQGLNCLRSKTSIFYLMIIPLVFLPLQLSPLPTLNSLQYMNVR